VTAHEVAHQWWAHQVIGALVQGVTMLDETFAQYSALMVQEQEYGKAKMRKFLKFELDRYLRDRAAEVVEEMPLALVENQPYIHYRKGSIVTYALKDYLGEDVVNRTLARYDHDKAFQQPPYTTTPSARRPRRRSTRRSTSACSPARRTARKTTRRCCTWRNATSPTATARSR
jgi:aminopeptidase N